MQVCLVFEHHIVQEFDARTQPRNPKGLYYLNLHRNSSLQTTIKRTFGVWKSRRAILNRRPPFPYMTQVKLVGVCSLLHNFLNIVEANEEWD